MSASTRAKVKVMVIAHGHPDHEKGGGEIAAYNLHKQVATQEGFDSVFFARHGRRELVHGGTPNAGTGREKEIIAYAVMPDWFRFSQPDKALVWRDFRQALEACKPDIVHFHHYLHLGLELIREVRNYNADIRVVLTLHEYYAICHNQGQMVKTDRSLCYRSSPDACAQCFSQYSAQDFMLRKLFIQSHLDNVDTFIAPSQFLKNRYVEWGLHASRITVIENLLEDTVENTDNTDREYQRASTTRVRFAFFGQINWFKGLDLLLDAIAMLPRTLRQQVQLDINGSGL
ncbi:MAG: glycosyltransferase, partial [Granulosicoccus sp.]